MTTRSRGEGRTLFRAEAIFTGQSLEPLRDGALVLDEEGTVINCAPATAADTGADRVVYAQVLIPGVINAHVHLIDAAIEEPVPGGDGLVGWVGRLLERRGRTEPASDEQIRAVIDRMQRGGTVAIGEVTNSDATLPAIDASGIRCLFIHELIGFPDAVSESRLPEAIPSDRRSPFITHTLGAHAPYSVSPRLMSAIADRTRRAGVNMFQHLAEDSEERALYESGSGRWEEFLRSVDSWEPSWSGTGNSPIEFYDRLGLLDDHFVAVHLTDARRSELELLARRGVRVVLSPTSNLHITGRLPDVRAMVSLGIRFAFGTDGRGSNPSVDVFDEAALLLRHVPELDARVLLRALTAHGAEILGFPDLGRFLPGTRPGVIAIEVPVVDTDSEGLARSMILDADQRAPVGDLR